MTETIYEAKKNYMAPWKVICLSVVLSLILNIILMSENRKSANEGFNSFRQDMIESDIKYLREKVSSLEGKLITVLDGSKVELRPSSDGYGVSRTDHGDLFISLVDVKKFADGHKVTINIGNPNFAIFPDVNLKVRYNKSDKNISNWIEWWDTVQSTEHKIKENLNPGTWNKVEIILSPSTEEQTGWIEIEPEIARTILNPYK